MEKGPAGDFFSRQDPVFLSLLYSDARGLLFLKHDLSGESHKERNEEEGKDPAKNDKDRQHAQKSVEPHRNRQVGDQYRTDQAHAKTHEDGKGNGRTCGHKAAVLKAPWPGILFSKGHAPL